jgi:NifB/MoaA-like Fe-S oxidoreductase
VASDPEALDGPAVVVTGEYGQRVLSPVVGRLERLAGRPIRLLTIPNDFFGGNTAVAGLMVGVDIAMALSADTDPAGVYVLPDVALSGDTFIDDMSLVDVASAAHAPVVVAPTTVSGLLGAVR